MKKKTARTTAAKPAAKRSKSKGYGQLVTAISTINTRMVGRVATVANQALVLRNWMVGAYIVEFEQQGADRAKYGARLLETLAGDLKEKGVKGLGLSTPRDCRTFCLRYPEIPQPAVGEIMEYLHAPLIRQPVVGELLPGDLVGKIRGPVDTKSQKIQISQPAVGKLAKSGPSANSATSGGKTAQAPLAQLPTPLKPDQLARISWAH